ncbi:beta-N-acetylhexosaminidase [Draconibacterium sp. IB214405]|uniref:beta-N-acetylhexosaminidase n=1 Tax=Draconibacterium sp. IB214405 TaxID=3097352 RepID=UPI002A0AE7E8|nr:beta-N-acetylhexosaminidase [Draconibacterium sp. IB214405]MDX8338539.1 beta-N-acetylhexosaminidase [Draconibacterium sp. IB214405]
MIKKILYILLVLIFILVVGGFLYYRLAIYSPPLISEDDRAEIELMPLPGSLKIHNGEVDLSKGINISFINVQNEFLNKAANRFSEDLELIYGVTSGEKGVMLQIICSENAENGIPQFGDDESYSLEIDKHITLSANTKFGINHGLETILQLVKKSDEGVVLPKLEIEDIPRFPWRGVMLDVCRHWMPKEVVLRTIDAMAAVKMNVFHWHLSEDQGFRVESKVFPKLHKVGSNGKYYTQDDIREIVAYAAERGIRIIPEFDVPGHSKSWQIAYPELSTLSTEQTFVNEGGEMFSPPLDPTKEIVYEFLDRFIEEMVSLFPDEYFHIGGDEVEPKFWNESESVQEFMKKNEIKDAHELQAYFNTRIYQLVKKHGKTMVGWEEITSENLDDDIVIQSWRGQKSLFEAVQQGKRGILSAGWYLDLKLHSDKHYEVDPLIMPGAVDMEPDTTHWKVYDLSLEIPSGEMVSKLVVFDRNPESVYGFMEVMGSRAGFKNGLKTDDRISFQLESQMGTLNFSGELIGDSLSGKLSLALFKFEANGKQVAGSDISGTKLPKIEVVKPLNEEQRMMVLGGEAAMWSEVVGENNVDSRIWPRTAVIAEKLWSPAELTANTHDMFRRLECFSSYLIKRGNPFFHQQDQILQALIPQEGLPYLKTLVQQLEEVKYYERLGSLGNIYGVYLPDLPMNGVVDAARPESLSARKFNKMVEDYVASPENDLLKSEIREQLQLWSANHEKLKPWLISEELQKVARLSETFSMVAEQSLTQLREGGSSNDQQKQELQQAIELLEKGENGMLCAVAEGFRKLNGF